MYYSRLAAVSQQRTAADRALSRRSPLLRDCNGATKLNCNSGKVLLLSINILILRFYSSSIKNKSRYSNSQ